MEIEWLFSLLNLIVCPQIFVLFCFCFQSLWLWALLVWSLDSQETNASTRTCTNVELIWKTDCHLAILGSFSNRKRRVTLLAGVTDTDYQRKIGLLPLNGDRENYIWNTACFLVFSCPIVKVNRRWPFSHPTAKAITSDDSDPLGKIDYPIILKKKTTHLRYWMKTKEIWNRIWKKEVIIINYGLMTTYVLAYYVNVCVYIIVYVNHFILLSPDYLEG